MVSRPAVELHSVPLQLFRERSFKDGLQRVQRRLRAVLHIYPVEQLQDVSVQPEQPRRQQAGADNLPHRFCNTGVTEAKSDPTDLNSSKGGGFMFQGKRSWSPEVSRRPCWSRLTLWAIDRALI